MDTILKTMGREDGANPSSEAQNNSEEIVSSEKRNFEMDHEQSSNENKAYIDGMYF